MIDARANLEQLIADRGDDFLSVSRLIGRNAAYIQQFIRRGVPRKLDEEDRRTLARYFGVDETLLGAPTEPAMRAPPSRTSASPGRGRPMALVPMLGIGASAGPGALVGEEVPEAHVSFETAWLRKLGSNPDSLSIIRVTGDSMSPTLADADDILVDRADNSGRLRDGIYVLRMDDTLLVKRLAVNPVARTLTIKSDNPAYPVWSDCKPDSVDVIGRVIWVGRKLV
jgi:SOS-response transcriptional repressor LexA